tara:strand:+ start:152 stop:592 length:441 start_codon:yes stop_codon:yes gene_type:complete
MEDIKIKVPMWAIDIKDEGLIVFIALLTKIHQRYGWDEWYNLHLTDVNKVKGGLGNSKKLFKPYFEWIDIAQPYNDELQFRMKRIFAHELVSVELTSQRHIRVWCYLLGCMNSNLLDQDYYGARPPQSTAFTNENEHQLFRSYEKH